MESSINLPAVSDAPRNASSELGRPESIRNAQRFIADPRGSAEATRLTVRAPAEPQDVSKAVQKINDFVKVVRRDLEFSVDEATGRTVITVKDSETDEVIRQIPPEEVLSIAENLEDVQGLLLKAKA
jgi:flagellar protein FlaG